MNQTTMSHIFLVIASERDCCANRETTLRAFGEKYEAESYMEDIKRRVAHNEGLGDAVERMMEATWDKEHPALPCPDNDPQGGYDNYNAWCEKDNVRRDARWEETKRLLALVGYDNDIARQAGRDSDIFLREVPFGFEVVKPEEVAQAAE